MVILLSAPHALAGDCSDQGSPSKIDRQVLLRVCLGKYIEKLQKEKSKRLQELEMHVFDEDLFLSSVDPKTADKKLLEIIENIRSCTKIQRQLKPANL